MRVGVAGGTGYAGAELLRILSGHPNAEVTLVTSQSQAGKAVADAAPHLRGLRLPTLEPFDADTIAARCDVIFLAQESGFAFRHARQLLERGLRVIDLSADFRLADAEAYAEWYRTPHEDAGLLAKAVYGMPEIVGREVIAEAQLVANPGCYPTGACLAVAPVVAGGLVDGVIVFDSKSGVSGAGRSKTGLDYHFAELDGSFKAYNPVRHRHVPEIEQTLARISGVSSAVRFTPHLVPVSRGIFTTAHVPLRVGVEVALSLYRNFYQDCPFVTVLPEGAIPATKHVHGSNACHVAVQTDPRTNYAVCFSVIDNLVKGAAGQAVQNMNLMFGLDEAAGLDVAGVFP